MEKQIKYGRWIEVETTHGTEFIPQHVVGLQSAFRADDVADYVSGKFISARLVDGYGARLSMDGYLDCTDWTIYETEQEAIDALEDMYDEE
jgi:hypothetical protein